MDMDMDMDVELQALLDAAFDVVAFVKGAIDNHSAERLLGTLDGGVRLVNRELGSKVSAQYEALQEAFEAFDLNGDGFISKSEMVEILTRPCKSMPNQKPWTIAAAEAAFDKMDYNRDGLLDIDEFSESWSTDCALSRFTKPASTASVDVTPRAATEQERAFVQAALGAEPSVLELYTAVVKAAKAWAAREGVAEDKLYIWIDYSSVDQDDLSELTKGVNSLGLFVCSADAFITIEHPDYFDRGWWPLQAAIQLQD